MPYTAAQLSQYYTAVNQGAVPDATTTASFQTAANQNAAGTITDAQALAVAIDTRQAFATTDVAVATYALFTGATPTAAGINYLVNNPGTGYNTSYYNGSGGTATAIGPGGFDLENRYFNAAMNLAGTPGAVGNAAFVSTYGSLTLAQTISSAYETIIGTANVGGNYATAAIAAITNAIPYFQSVAAARAAGANQDIATKAVIVSYILEEAIKADVGTYAKALDQFDAAVATGTAVYNTNLLTTYGAGGSGFNPALGALANGQTFAASTSANTVTNLIGVAAGGAATVTTGANATLSFSNDIAANNGQLIVNVAGATTAGNTSDVLNLNFVGQSIATAPSFITDGVETVNIGAQLASGASAATTTLSIGISDFALKTVNIIGNETVVFSAPTFLLSDGTVSGGSLQTVNASGATAAENIDVSGAGSAALPVTVTGSPMADTISVGSYTSVSGGGGADTIVVYAPSATTAYSSVTDGHQGEVLKFFGATVTSLNTTVISNATFQQDLDAAAARGAGVASVFNFGGDTYVVEDNSAATTFQAGTDFVIKLVGTHTVALGSGATAGALVLVS